MTQHERYEAGPEEKGTRLDLFVCQKRPDLTRSHIQKLLEEDHLTVNGNKVKAGYKIRTGDVIELTIPQAKVPDARPQDIPIEIVYEDEDLAVVNKPRGMVVHPAAGHEDGTLVNALMYRFKGRLSGINGVLRPGIVHRIDKDTSGLLVVCKSDRAHVALSERLKTHDIERVYHAVVHGVMKDQEGTIDAPIGRMDQDRKKMMVRADGRRAVTHYKVLRQYPHFAYLEVRLETGRTHQIRVHMQYIGHPVLGDPVYGPARESTAESKKLAGMDFWPGQILHAKVLGFVHPVTGEWMHFDSELPDYFKKVLETIDV